MITKEQAIDFILVTLNNLIDTFPPEDRFVPDKDTVLFGPGSRIDSLTLVSFVVDLEGMLASDYSHEVSLTDDRAMTREKSPFGSVHDLAEYIAEITDPNLIQK